MDILDWFRGTSTIVFTGVCLLILAWLRFVKTGPVYKGKKLLVGKTVLITGGSSGLGKETALQLAKRKARVVIASRNENKGSEAAADIRRKSGNDQVVFKKLDVSSLQDVWRFVNQFIGEEDRLDIIINNAGVIEHGLSCDGFNRMLATNVLGPFILTKLLLPMMIKTSESSQVRILNISSDAYLITDLTEEKIDDLFEKKYEKFGVRKVLSQYSATKLMVIYFTTELNKLLREREPQCDNVTTYIVHPGTVNSKLGFDFAQKSKFLTILRWCTMLLFSRSAFYACQTVLYCALEDGIERNSGKYFADMKINELWPHACDANIERRLWKKCEEATGLNEMKSRISRRSQSSVF